MADALADWLALREAADAAARSAALARRVAERLGTNQPLPILELGTGTGSNIRYLAPRLGGRQEWLAVDRNAGLLSLLPQRFEEWARTIGGEVRRDGGDVVIRAPGFECRVRARQWDLDDLAADLFTGCRLVTASALLDLVSAEWLRTLASRCAASGAAALFALTYDGRSSCDPAEPEDDWIRDLLNRHQHRDKGLGGPAAGPAAVACARSAFAEVQYDVHAAASPWTLGLGESDLQRQLVDGWAQAAFEMTPGERPIVEAWRGRRFAHLDAGRSRIVVDHQDVAAWPGGPPVGGSAS